MTPSCLQVRIKSLTRLGYTMTSSISRGSNSSFNDDVSNKTIDSFPHKEGKFKCEGWGDIIVRSLTLNTFSNVYIQCKKVNTWIHSHMKQFLIKCIFSFFSRNKIKQITVLCRSKIQGCLHFQQTLSIEVWPSCVFRSGSNF